MSEGMCIGQISHFMTVTARIAAQVFLNTCGPFPHGTVSVQSKLHIRVVLCVTRYCLGLCDMTCYSMNGSHASQGGVPMKRMSQIKKSVFHLPWCVPRLTMVLLSLHFFLPIHHPVLGNQLLSTQKGGSQA